MIVRQRLLASTMALAVVGMAQPAAAAPWTRGFVVSAYEYAFRYGGRSDFARTGEIEPGVDCPHGSGTHFADDQKTLKALARQKWRDHDQVQKIAAPPGLEQDGQGNVIPLAQRTKEDQEKALSGRKDA